MESLTNYVRESYNELVNNVTWPDYGSLQNDTIVVIIATLLFALIIFGMDSIANFVLSNIYKLNG